jgi:hypothetical protein
MPALIPEGEVPDDVWWMQSRQRLERRDGRTPVGALRRALFNLAVSDAYAMQDLVAAAERLLRFARKADALRRVTE